MVLLCERMYQTIFYPSWHINVKQHGRGALGDGIKQHGGGAQGGGIDLRILVEMPISV